MREGGAVGLSVDGEEHALGPDDLQMVLQPLEGYQVERAGTHAVALNLELTDDLRREGLAREVVHAVQAARKSAGLNVEDRISLRLGGDGDLLDAVARARGLRVGRDARDLARRRTAPTASRPRSRAASSASASRRARPRPRARTA